MKIAVDLDGVVFDFMRHWTDLWRAATGVEIDPRAGQLYGTLHTQAGLTLGAFWEWYRSAGGFDGMPLIPGIVEQLTPDPFVRRRQIVAQIVQRLA